MSVRVDHLIDRTLDTSNETVTANHDFKGITPLRVTLYVKIVETDGGNGPQTTISVDVSPDKGATLIDYDKLITDGGVDGPVASITYTATLDDIISMSLEDAIDYIAVTAAGNGVMDGSNFHVVDVWLVTIF